MRPCATTILVAQIFNLLYRRHYVGKARELPGVFERSNIPDAFGETPNAARETRALVRL
jgi:hypothetical protein